MIYSRLTNLKSLFSPRLSKSLATNAAENLPASYSTGVQVMHWSMGGAMLGCVGFVLAAQNTQDKTAKGNFMYWHKSLGLLSAILLAPRLAIKLTSKGPGPVVGSSSIEHLGATISHYVLYGFAIALPVTGVVMGSFSGFGLPFFFTTIPSIKKDSSIAGPAYQYHKIAGQAFEYFVPLHVTGAFYHVFKGHTIFPRIASFLGKNEKVAKAANSVPK